MVYLPDKKSYTRVLLWVPFINQINYTSHNNDNNNNNKNNNKI